MDRAGLCERLRQVDSTQPSITGMGRHLVAFARASGAAGTVRVICSCWLSELVSGTAESQLALMYLANEVLQSSRQSEKASIGACRPPSTAGRRRLIRYMRTRAKEAHLDGQPRPSHQPGPTWRQLRLLFSNCMPKTPTPPFLLLWCGRFKRRTMLPPLFPMLRPCRYWRAFPFNHSGSSFRGLCTRAAARPRRAGRALALDRPQGEAHAGRLGGPCRLSGRHNR